MPKWIEPEHSKEKVKKSGREIIGRSEERDIGEAVRVFLNWRSAHAFPMQIMLDLLRKHAIRVDKNAVAVQRLKRAISILRKLQREDGMELSRMEDIAGCRAVVSTAAQVQKVRKSLIDSPTQNVLHRERDYISYPKESGYRGIHLIYKYNCGKTKYRGMAVELQIRSKIQHSWATAVEVVGLYTQQALKASSGDQVWLDFFMYCSAEFSKLEKCILDPRFEGVDTFSEMKNCYNSINLKERLSAFKVATKAISTDKKGRGGFYLLYLDLESQTVSYTWFGKNQLEEATREYNEIEEENEGDNSKDVVLVSAGSVKDLKKAYPNYFADTEMFEKNLTRVFKAMETGKSK